MRPIPLARPVSPLQEEEEEDESEFEEEDDDDSDYDEEDEEAFEDADWERQERRLAAEDKYVGRGRGQ